MIRRIMSGLAALLIAWLGLLAPHPVVAVASAHTEPAHVYDHCRTAASTYTTAERGPLGASAGGAIHDSVDRWSHGALECPREPTSRAATTYDALATLAQSASATGTTRAPVKLTGREVSSLQRVGVAAKGETELVQRWMSRAELDATIDTGLVRGGREGTHYVTDFANHNALRARQRLALPQTGEVRVQLEVPRGAFSPPKRVDPDYFMPGGGMERTASGAVQCRVVCVWD